MSEPMILHHYEMSPYAEKIRLMFGHTQMHWLSVLSPEQPPRPNVDPLSGGYRRIPIAQVGADIFCDTFLISQEIAGLANAPELDPTQATGEATTLIDLAEGDVFFAAIGSVPPLTLLGTMLANFGVFGTLRFAFDRIGMMQGGTARPPQGDAAKTVLGAFQDELEQQLADRAFLAGDQPSLADFAAYHPLWLHLNSSRSTLDPRHPNIGRWFARIASIGHGRREDATADRAFAAARSAEPRALPEAAGAPDERIGKQVSVAPNDYGTVPVTGRLVALTSERCIVERETGEFGRLHVHFPQRGYSLTFA